ncbi:MAG: hypothetical protein QXR73_03100 [Candidatus Micrarchaeaceae archaeon]
MSKGKIMVLNNLMKAHLRSFIQASVYAIIFLLLYLTVLHFFPYNQAVGIINTCLTNSTARYTNLLIAPVSYFEMIITVQEFHLTGQAVSWLFSSNLAFVVIGIYATVIYLNDFSVKYRKKFNVNKLIIASVIATWALSLTLIPCGTGISIIGVSLNLFTGLAIFKDGLQLKAQGLMQRWPRVLAYVIADAPLLVIVISYLISGPIQHLLGLCLFALILFLIEPYFRYVVKGLFAKRSAKASQ